MQITLLYPIETSSAFCFASSLHFDTLPFFSLHVSIRAKTGNKSSVGVAIGELERAADRWVHAESAPLFAPWLSKLLNKMAAYSVDDPKRYGHLTEKSSRGPETR